ncbi:btk-binding protein-related [Anaeramoeba ignava]|uniref:Btk-binding protein-related n=1 Tax=Anaeramoeba ignava TaxID=1746090 RepID=A0A9Q0R8U0_ANAIG|nr:btk-binding protein-related [Anaeramoeba ignava]
MNQILFFGRNKYPRLIENEPEKIKKPIQFKFENENEKQIKQIESSYFSTIFLFENGKAIEYLNDSYQNPEKIQIEENIQKVTVVSRSEAILTKEGNVFENQEKKTIQKLTQIQNIPKGKIIDIQCGYWHSIMLIENPERKLYSCGYYQYNGLGNNQTTYEFTEIKSSLFENDNIIDFSVGNLHTLILTSNPKLIGFGENYYAQLGIGNTYNQSIPIQIELPKLRFNENISNYHVLCRNEKSFLYYSPPSFSNLEEDLIKLFERKEFCDISFKTKNGEIIEAHKLILKYRLNQNQNQIEKLKEIISKKSIQRIKSNI